MDGWVDEAKVKIINATAQKRCKANLPYAGVSEIKWYRDFHRDSDSKETLKTMGTSVGTTARNHEDQRAIMSKHINGWRLR